MECVYDQDSDRRRRSTLRRDMETLQQKKNTLEALIGQIRSAPEEQVAGLVECLRGRGWEDGPALTVPAELNIERKVGREKEVRVAQDVGVLERDRGGVVRHFGGGSGWGWVYARSGEGEGEGEVEAGAVVGGWTEVTGDGGWMEELLVSENRCGWGARADIWG